MIEPMTVVIPTEDIFSDAGKHPAGVPWQVTERHAAVLFDLGKAQPWRQAAPVKPEPVKEVVHIETPTKGKEK